MNNSSLALLLGLLLAAPHLSLADVPAPAIIAQHIVPKTPTLITTETDRKANIFILHGLTNSSGLYTNVTLLINNAKQRRLFSRTLPQLNGRTGLSVYYCDYPTIVFRSLDSSGTNVLFNIFKFKNNRAFPSGSTTLTSTQILRRDLKQFFSIATTSTGQTYQKLNSKLRPLSSIFIPTNITHSASWVGNNALFFNIETGPTNRYTYSYYNNAFKSIGSNTQTGYDSAIYIQPKGGFMIRTVLDNTVTPSRLRWQQLDAKFKLLKTWDITAEDTPDALGSLPDFIPSLPRRRALAPIFVEWQTSTATNLTRTIAKF